MNKKLKENSESFEMKLSEMEKTISFGLQSQFENEKLSDISSLQRKNFAGF